MFWLYDPSLWPWPWRQQTNLFWNTIWLIMMHHHTESGNKRFSSWGDILQRNIYWNSEPFLWPWPWPQQSNPNFSQTIQLMMMCHQSKFSCKRIISSEDILESHVLIIWSFTVTLTLKTASQSFQKTIWLIMMHHHTKFGSKRFSDSEDMSGQTIINILKFAVTMTLKTASQSF